jgi:hypothetical protein
MMADSQPAARRPQTSGNPHGKRSSWVLVGMVVLAFAVGGIAMALHAWWLFWVCVGVVVLAIPAGKAIGIMDDTVAWETTAALEDSTVEAPAHDPAAASTGRHRVEKPGPE